MKKNSLTFSAALLAIITFVTAFASGPKRGWDAKALENKANYLFFEGINAHLRGETDSYFALVEQAHASNPVDIDINNEYGMFLVQLQSNDSAAVASGIGFMKEYFERNPADIYSALRYALINQSTGNLNEAMRTFGIMHRHFPEKSGITRRYAEILAQAGGLDSLDRALSLYDSLEVTEGNSLELATSRMRLLFLRNDTAAVLKEGRRQWRNAPHSVENNVFLADVFATFQQNDSALTYYNRAYEIDSLSPMAAYSLASFYNSIGDSIAFDREIFRTLKLEGLDMPTKMQVMRNYVSELYADSLQRPRILALFNELVAIHPHEPELRKLYAAYLASTDDYAGAAEQQDRGMDLEPDDENGWRMLASMYSMTGDYDSGLKAINRGLHYFPQSAILYLNRGGYLIEADSLNEASKTLMKALELTDSTDSETLSGVATSIADLYSRKEMTDSAIAYYRKALKHNPYNITALNNCAYFLACEERELDEARRMIERVMNEDANEPTWIDTYAWVLFKQKEYERAREEIDRAVKLSTPPSADILEHAGDIYFWNNSPDAAVDFWQRALDLDPDNELLKRKVVNKTYFFK